MTDRPFACWKCGRAADVALRRMNRTGKPGIWACPDHQDRTKCSIEGCARSTKRQNGAPWEWLCAVHWKRYCPPRSLRRRAYFAFFRKAKRFGWNDDLAAKYWRFWDSLTSGANKLEQRGYPDMKEINKMFGWDDD